jgi:hypothetical protein
VSQASRSTRSFLEVIVAVVLVVAVAAVLLGVLSWLAGAFWWLVKVAVLALVVFLVVRLVMSRRR